MRNIERRVQRIEVLVNEDKGLTADDVELILSCMPKETADAIMKELLKLDDRQPAKLCGKANSRSGLYGKTLEIILNNMTSESAEILRGKLKINNKQMMTGTVNSNIDQDS